MDIAVAEPNLRNRLLELLADRDWDRIRQSLVLLQVSTGEVLCEPCCRLDSCYFPLSTIISVQRVGSDGASTEAAAIGNEGLVGVSLFLGDGMMANRIAVQNRGLVYRMKREFLLDEFGRGGAMQRIVLRYTQALIAQILQTAVCNQRHSIEMQLCRWLLQSRDRLASERLSMTHELLANTLGVRREGITEAARKLQTAGLISYQRGHITIINRDGLEASCCECYEAIRQEHDAVRASPTWANDLKYRSNHSRGLSARLA